MGSKNQIELEKVSSVLQKNNFANLKRQIFKDLILYGNSFISMESSGLTLKLQRFELKDLSFSTDWVQEPPFKSSQEKMVDIKEIKNPSINYNPENVMHYKVEDLGCEPFGFSNLRHMVP